jgi:Family of unknown function (DUF5412)
MKNIKKIAFISAFLIVQNCSGDFSNTIIQKVDSPDGKLVATVFTTNGDATVPFVVNVTITGKGEVVPTSGNIFRGIHSENAKVFWVENKKLVICTDAEVFLLMKEYAGVVFELRGL